MAGKVYWYDATHTILIYEVLAPWSASEFAETVTRCHAMIAEQAHIVHAINDFTQSHVAPAKLLAATWRIERSVPPNRGILVGVGVNLLLERLLGVARGLAPRATQNTHIAKTVDEAIALIQRLSTKPSASGHSRYAHED